MGAAFFFCLAFSFFFFFGLSAIPVVMAFFVLVFKLDYVYTYIRHYCEIGDWVYGVFLDRRFFPLCVLVFCFSLATCRGPKGRGSCSADAKTALTDFPIPVPVKHPSAQPQNPAVKVELPNFPLPTHVIECVFCFISRCMRPEGPWQRRFSNAPLYMTESCPQPLRVILGQPFPLHPLSAGKRKR